MPIVTETIYNIVSEGVYNSHDWENNTYSKVCRICNVLAIIHDNKWVTDIRSCNEIIIERIIL